MLSRQEIYNKVRDHLLTQNAKSVIDEGYESCRYRGPNDLKCAIGILIEDSEYFPDFEGVGPDAACLSAPGYSNLARREFKFNTFLANKFGKEKLTFLRDLQLIHDSHEPIAWLSKLTDFAKKNGLEP